MRNLVLAAAAAALFSAPAVAQPVPESEIGREMAEALPSPGEVAGMTQTLDRVLGAFLDLDVRPIVEAVDPHAPNLRRGERSLRDIGRRDDPYFEQRMRSNLYGVSGAMNRMMDQMVVLAPVLQRSLEGISRDMEDALARPAPPRGEYD